MENIKKIINNINLEDYSTKPIKYNLQLGANKPMSFGDDNLFPIKCYQAVQDSPIQSAIIKSQILYTIGGGLEYNKNIKQPNLSYKWEELFELLVTDYIYFNAFSLQVIKNKDNKTYSYFHQPVEQVRFANYSKDNNKIEKAYLNVDWSRGSNNKYMVEIDMWDNNIGEIEIGKPYLMYFKQYKPNELFYAIPQYYSFLNWIGVDKALSQYYINFIKNNMSVNKIITYPFTLTQDEIEEVYSNIKKTFSGVENAGSTLLLFGENGVSPVIEDLTTLDSDLYNTLVQITFQYLISGNQLTSPMLAGLSPTSGFSSTSDELITAYELYMNTVIKGIRKFIIDKLFNLIQFNEIDVDPKFSITDINITKVVEGENNNEVKKEL